MPNWHLLKSESFTLDRAKALEFAAKHAGLPHSPVEREVRADRLKTLIAILRNGLALPFQWATVLYEGQKVRMNGQHSSAAIMEVGADLPAKLSFHMDHYQADNRGGMVELFRQFDTRWSSRKPNDVAGAFQGLVPELAGCNKRIMKVAAEGLSWEKRIVEGLPAPAGDDAYDFFHDEVYLEFFKWIDGIWNGRKEFFDKQVVGAMYRTHEVSQSAATAFWREVSFGPDYFTDDMKPGAVLIGELSRALEDKDFRDKEFETAAHYYKKAIKAWNAHCAGQRIASLKVTKTKGWPEVSQFAAEEEAA